MKIQIDNARVPYQWTCHSCLLSLQPFFNVRNLDNLDTPLENDHNDFVLPSIALLNQHRKHLSVAHLNTQSMKSTFTQFESYLSTHQFDIVTMSETWLKDNKNLLSHYEIKGYEKDFRNRDAKRGGGVGYYIKSDIPHKSRKDIESFDTTIEHQWIELTGKNRLCNVLIGIVYQPSSKSRDKLDWLVKFESLVSQVAIVHHGPIIITGDLNIDLLVPSPEHEAYDNILGTLNLKQLVSEPTRKSKTLIDHVITNTDTKLIAGDVVFCDEISDHDSPFCILKINKPRYEPRHKYIRDERNLVIENYVNDFRELPLNIVYAFDNTSDKVYSIN